MTGKEPFVIIEAVADPEKQARGYLPAGFRKASVVIRDAYFERIKAICARTGAKPWKVLDLLLERGLQGVELPPPGQDLRAMLNLPPAEKEG